MNRGDRIVKLQLVKTLLQLDVRESHPAIDIQRGVQYPPDHRHHGGSPTVIKAMSDQGPVHQLALCRWVVVREIQQFEDLVQADARLGQSRGVRHCIDKTLPGLDPVRTARRRQQRSPEPPLPACVRGLESLGVPPRFPGPNPVRPVYQVLVERLGQPQGQFIAPGLVPAGQPVSDRREFCPVLQLVQG